ncbi:polyprenyl synthetase family protein [Microaerobacter geothermalis]|uniref:polyprenyl synthetase family protein n=1 Tax=Microaerobacter geothermalis TaxID=674972 RepID=UPI001F1A9131|nr:farnesyl diphosphate synthase [Microaerobacter geothermalis]MCF6094439.1 polyprenyl synthetase family protein [Microaerobacter geothermalis]
MRYKHIIPYLQEKTSWVENDLVYHLKEIDMPSRLRESMEYSLLAGGKRIRPALVFASIESLGKDPKIGLSVASAIEMIHTYSLIHDDLPSMDNDDYRRGKLTNHKVYGEAMAILAGDALLTMAFGTIMKTKVHYPDVRPEALLQLIEEISKYAGPYGMVGGQVVDIISQGEPGNLETLRYIHQHKTADMIICSVRSGAILAGASSEQLYHLTRFASSLGLAFQIQDDILDEIGNSERMGKTAGSDRSNQKLTYPSLIGIEASQEEVNLLVSEAKDQLKLAKILHPVLFDLADFLLHRES